MEDAHPKEKDASGIDNNVLTPEEIVKEAPATAAIMSSVGPDSTTVKLAGEAPLESKADKPTDLPGTYPETPAADLDKQVSINPLPAAPGAVNPIKLAPGEKVPDTIAGEDINSHVKLDPESYEKADTLPSGFGLPPVGKNTIPESSLPIVGAGDDVTVSSVGPGATTVGLAGQVPLEPKVPAVVKESQEKAGVDPEASAVPEEVKEKSEVESELLKKVPEVPSTSEGTSGKGAEKSETDKTVVATVAATITGVGAAALATAVATKDKAVEQVNAAVPQVTAAATDAAKSLPEPVKQILPVPAQEAISTSTKEAIGQEVSPEVPAEVKQSIQEAGKSPEAAANTEAVEEKKAVEAELLKEVKPVAAVGESSKKPEETTEAVKKPETNGTETTTTKAPETPAKPSSSKAPEAKVPDSPATVEKKKKNRLSVIFSKLKHKVSSKDKA